MGLLDKAKAAEGRGSETAKPDAKVASSKSKGLLNRARLLSEITEENNTRHTPDSVIKKNVQGLLARAQSLRIRPESEFTAPKGLLARAIEMQRVSPSKGLLRKAEEFKAQDLLLRPSGGLLSRASAFRKQDLQSGQNARGLLSRAMASRNSGDNVQPEPDSVSVPFSSDIAQDIDYKSDFLKESENIPPTGADSEDVSSERIPDISDDFSNISSENLSDFADDSDDTVSENIPAADEVSAGIPEKSGESAETSVTLKDSWHEHIPDLGFNPDAEFIEEAAESSSEELQYRESKKYEDPALDSHLTREGHDQSLTEIRDPFDEWEKEAESIAEKEVRNVYPDEESETTQAFLFKDDEDAFLTRSDLTENQTKKKIENYQSLFEINSELNSVDDYREFWETVMYSLIGQLGAEKICIFSSQDALDETVYLSVAALGGFETDETWTVKETDELYDQALATDKLFYVSSLDRRKLSENEKNILKVTDAKICIPVISRNKLIALILISGSVSGNKDYNPEDIEFAGLTGKMAANGAVRILGRINAEKEVADIKQRNIYNQTVIGFASEASSARTMDELYDLISVTMKEKFHADSFILHLYSPGNRKYRIFSGNCITPASIEKFSMESDNELILSVSQIVRLYDFRGFRNNQDIINNYSNDDLAVMRNYFLLPLIHQNWLSGFITIHRTSSPLTDIDREMMVNFAGVAAPFIANGIMKEEREGVFRDPFSPVEDRLRTDLQKALEYQSCISLAEFRIKNIKRIFSLNPADQVIRYLQEVSVIISNNLYETDYYTRIGQGRFAIILPGRSRKEALAFLSKIVSEIKNKRMLSGSPVEIQYSETVITAPEDTDDAEKMLSLID
jgi:GGDEF domain-containing protein